MAQWQKQSYVLHIGICNVRKPRKCSFILDKHECEKIYKSFQDEIQAKRHLTSLLQILSSSFINFISPTYTGHFQKRACPATICEYFTDKSLYAMWEWPLQSQWLGIDHIWPERISPKEATISNISILMIWWFYDLVIFLSSEMGNFLLKSLLQQ